MLVVFKDLCDVGGVEGFVSCWWCLRICVMLVVFKDLCHVGGVEGFV